MNHLFLLLLFSPTGMLFSIDIIDKYLKRVRYFKSVVHEQIRNPIESLSIRTNVKRRFDDEDPDGKEDEMKNYYRFQLTYVTLDILRLPSPYDTHCLDYSTTGVFSAIECRNDCLLNKTLKEVKKIPFSITVWNASEIYKATIEYGEFNDETDETIDYYSKRQAYYMSMMNYKHVNNLDIADPSVTKELVNIENICNTLCSRPDCRDVLTMTKIGYDYPKKENSPEMIPLRFEVLVPTKPVLQIVHNVKISWTEYVVSVLSCFGIWFGLSILSVNPFNLTITLASKASPKSRAKKSYCVRVREELKRSTDQFAARARAVVASARRH